jgi:hypothetical protein
VAAQIEGLMAAALVPAEIEAFAGLLDALVVAGFADASLKERTQMVHAIGDSDPAARQGLHALRGMTLLFFYGLPDEAGSNPNWDAVGYPGPNSAPPSWQLPLHNGTARRLRRALRRQPGVVVTTIPLHLPT